MRRNKAQISIFIILGLVMVMLVLGILFFVRVSDEGEIEEIADLPDDLRAVRRYVDNCIEEVAVPGIFLLADQGGFIYDYPDRLSTELGEVAYHLDSSETTGPQIVFMEQELSRFIEESINFCVKDFGNLSRLNLTFEEPEAETIISQENVIIRLDYLITLNTGEDRAATSEYRKEIPLRLRYLADIKDQIVSNILADSDIIDIEYLTDLGVNINMMPQDSDTLIYSLVDLESEIDDSLLVFNFAVRKEIDENNPPAIQKIGSQIAYIDELFNFQVDFSDDDMQDVELKDDTALFDINENGLISFTPAPSDSGDYEITIFASDRINEVAETFNLSITER